MFPISSIKFPSGFCKTNLLWAALNSIFVVPKSIAWKVTEDNTPDPLLPISPAFLEIPILTNSGSNFMRETTSLPKKFPKTPWVAFTIVESNLSSKVLLEILITLNLDPAPYELKFKLIDNHLLNQRNKVAHGQYLDIDIDIFIKTANETINLLQTFQEQIIDAAKAKRYLKHQVS